MDLLSHHSAGTHLHIHDIRDVSEATYGTYRSRTADQALINSILHEDDKVMLSVAISVFRKLVNEKKRGF